MFVLLRNSRPEPAYRVWPESESLLLALVVLSDQRLLGPSSAITRYIRPTCKYVNEKMDGNTESRETLHFLASSWVFVHFSSCLSRPLSNSRKIISQIRGWHNLRLFYFSPEEVFLGNVIIGDAEGLYNIEQARIFPAPDVKEVRSVELSIGLSHLIN